MSWRLHMVPCHVSTVEFRTLLSNVEKTDVNVASNYAFNGQVKMIPRHSGQLFNTSTSTGETGKRLAVHFT